MLKKDSTFNEQIKKIENYKPKWLPWVGADYPNLPDGKKLLIIGESHYLPSEDKDWYDDVDKEEFTRGFIEGNVTANREKNRTYILRNISETLLFDEPSDDQKIKLWNAVAYYNFVQRTMETALHRPKPQDFIDGWHTFFKIIDILNPDICLFAGVSVTSYNGAILEAEKEFSHSHDWDETLKFKSSNVKARKITINRADKKIPVLFIVHPTYRFGFKVSEWREFLDQQIPSYTSWLRGL